MSRHTSPVPHVFSAMALVLVGGCEKCHDDPVPPDPPEVHEVVVRPGTIIATPGSQFTLEASVKGKWGVLLAIGAIPGLTIEWTDPDGVLADVNTNPVTVTTPTAEGTSATLTAVVKSAGGSSVSSDPVTIHVSPLKSSLLATELDHDEGVSDWIDAEHPGTNPPAALLVQAFDNGSSVADWNVGLVGHVRLGRNFSPAAGANPSEATVFARGRYMELQPGPTAGQPWSTAADEVLADPMSWGGARYLSVRVGVEDLADQVDGIPVADWVKGEVEAAFNLLNRNRAGLQLDFVDVYEHGLVDDAGDAIPAEPDAHCAIASTVVPTWSSDQDVLHIVYAPDILFFATDTSTVPDRRTGWACSPAVSGGKNRLAFISWMEALPTTVAHELGHVLALNTSTGSGAAGHVNGLSGFDHSNIMWDASGLLYGGSRGHLSLGQIYRMNAHPTSWLNLVSPPSMQFSRACTSTAWGTCPSLVADLGG